MTVSIVVMRHLNRGTCVSEFTAQDIRDVVNLLRMGDSDAAESELREQLDQSEAALRGWHAARGEQDIQPSH